MWKVAAERGLVDHPTPSLVLAAVKAARSFGAFGRPLAPPASQAQVKGRLHSLARDRAAIGHHYDLSNDFYQLILDDNMAYSSGYWTSDAPDYTLEDSQTDKLDLVCRKVGLDRARGLRFLDVGCGWGSLSLHAAREYGARVVGITISAEQKALSTRRSAHSVWKTGSRSGSKIIERFPTVLSMRSRRSRWVSTSGRTTIRRT
ncbi:hypothetical protein GCM10020255_071260 [Rhodococcus baikonurensis]